MSKPPTDLEPAGWHRFFAAEANNRAWALTTRDRSPAEDREMLDAAHASAWHWAAAGTELHRMRAGMLLAAVHAELGNGPIALGFAREMRTYFLARAETPDWELAFVHAIHAHAAHAVGDGDAHARSHAEAVRAVEAIGDEEDRRIVRETLDRVPRP